MTRKQWNEIIKSTEKWQTKSLKKEYFRAVDGCLGSQCDEMYELDYDIIDIVERENYEKIFIRNNWLTWIFMWAKGH